MVPIISVNCNNITYLVKKFAMCAHVNKYEFYTVMSYHNEYAFAALLIPQKILLIF